MVSFCCILLSVFVCIFIYSPGQSPDNDFPGVTAGAWHIGVSLTRVGVPPHHPKVGWWSPGSGPLRRLFFGVGGWWDPHHPLKSICHDFCHIVVEPIISLRFSFVLDPHAVLELVLYPLRLTGGVGWSGGLEGLSGVVRVLQSAPRVVVVPPPPLRGIRLEPVLRRGCPPSHTQGWGS